MFNTGVFGDKLVIFSKKFIKVLTVSVWCVALCIGEYQALLREGLSDLHFFRSQIPTLR